jgi:uncharacterized protein (DUF488 family)
MGGNQNSGAIGVGYEGRDAELLIADLRSWNVALLVDVRLNPISRKKGLSKSALSKALEAHGIQYLHAPELGNLKDNREGYSELGTPTGQAARQNFADRITAPAAQATLDSIAHRAQTEFIALMCFEADERHCHRREVLTEVRARIDSLVAAR